MGLGKAITVCFLAIVVILGTTVHVLGPHMTAGSRVAMVGAAVVVAGLPLFAILTNWWVNQSVYSSSGRRPPEYEH
jgi:hypothetical protein